MRLFDRRRGRDAATASGADQPQANTLAIKGYDRLAVRKLLVRLPQLSQTEMAAVESYERANGQREVVLQKLNYLRGDEPLVGYDALSPDEISAALGDADLAGIDRVRTYERRLRNRDSVLVDIERLRASRPRPSGTQRSAASNWG